MKSRLVWVLTGVLVVLVAVGAIVGVVLTSDSDDLDARGTADAYFAAWTAGDAKQVCAMRTDEERERYPALCGGDGPSDQWVETMAKIDFAVDSIEVTGDAATVSFTQQDGSISPDFILTSEGTLSLVRVDGTWLVDEVELLGEPTATSRTGA